MRSPASVEFPEFLVALEVVRQSLLDGEVLLVLREAFKESLSAEPVSLAKQDLGRDRTNSGIVEI